MTIEITLTSREIEFLTDRLWWQARISPQGDAAQILKKIQQSLANQATDEASQLTPTASDLS